MILAYASGIDADNSGEKKMKHFVALLFVGLVAISPARAALVYDGYATGPGGLSTPYPAVNPEVFAGLIELTGGNSGSILAMSDDRGTLSHVGESWAMTYYSYAEVQAGAPVRFTPEQYARAAWASSRVLFPVMEYYAGPVDSDILYLYAEANVIIWKIMNPSLTQLSPIIALTGLYEAATDGTHDTFDWSGLMAVASGGPGRDEYLIPLASQGLTLGPVVPLPPAAWLLGSGLLGLVGVARRKKQQV